MKRILSTLIVLILIFILTTQVMVIAAQESNGNSNSIVSLSSNEVGLNTEFYLILNLTNISFTKFRVDITNTSNLPANEVTLAVSNMSTNAVATTFVVDKNLINLTRLGTVFTSPDKEQVINFEVKITSLDENIEDLQKELTLVENSINDLEESLATLNKDLEKLQKENQSNQENIENTIENSDNTISNLNNTVGSSNDTEYETLLKELQTTIANVGASLENQKEQKTTLEEKISNFSQATLSESVKLQVKENAAETEKDDFTNNETSDKNFVVNEIEDKNNMFGNIIDRDEMLKEQREKSELDMQKMKEQMGEMENNLKTANDKISSLTQNTTYQGSQNNYLKSLSINGVELESDFIKTTNYYFATIDKDVTSVTVNAVAEDSSAIVTIYGNTDLQEGKNKVIINVTADDGSIRTYRVFITK